MRLAPKGRQAVRGLKTVQLSPGVHVLLIADRPEVLRRVQAFRIAGLSVLQDTLDLDPGERWEQELYRQIDTCDVFLLF